MSASPSLLPALHQLLQALDAPAVECPFCDKARGGGPHDPTCPTRAAHRELDALLASEPGMPRTDFLHKLFDQQVPQKAGWTASGEAEAAAQLAALETTLVTLCARRAAAAAEAGALQERLQARDQANVHLCLALAEAVLPYEALLLDRPSQKWIAPAVWAAMEQACTTARRVIAAPEAHHG